VSKQRIAPILFLVAGALFLLAALRDMFFPTLLSHASGQGALSAAVGTVFLIIGFAQRRRLHP